LQRLGCAAIFRSSAYRHATGPVSARIKYDAFGLIGTTFTELEWKNANIFRESGPDKSKRIVKLSTEATDRRERLAG
jgi:hypothetical protein